MPILTKGVQLSMGPKSTGTQTYSVVANLQSFPNLLGAAEAVDVTTLADSFRHYIPGVRDTGVLAFGFLFDNGTSGCFRVMNGAGNVLQAFKLDFPDGTSFTFDGYVTCEINGGGVNDPVTFNANIMLASDITVANPTT